MNLFWYTCWCKVEPDFVSNTYYDNLCSYYSKRIPTGVTFLYDVETRTTYLIDFGAAR